MSCIFDEHFGKNSAIPNGMAPFCRVALTDFTKTDLYNWASVWPMGSRITRSAARSRATADLLISTSLWPR